MKFDSNQAWKDANASVLANRDVLMALAGVFVALPNLALATFLPPPEAPSGTAPEAAFALLGEYYTKAWPALVVMALLQLLCTLTMLTLFTDRSRPTVGEAMKRAVQSVLPVLAAQLLIALGIAALMVLGGALAVSAAARAIVAVVLIAGVAWVFLRTSLVTPVVVVEDQRNPIKAIARSWALTRGSAGRLLLFFVLLVVVAVVLYVLIGGVLGLLVSFVASGAAEVAVKDLIAAFLQAIATVYSVAIIAACHRQLAGPSAEAAARAFE
ncbi:glycerophosphoryl diester phosphodiesterase family protein [Novosphingobium kunmingense]|uniref:Glycerophosphoryl diester phosphodiesterase family protein n=1 Tax=Novosphingobium kunmingense TaxID=1211806 RepID=A0A2N0H732_9SPHN|nr:glycerophosphoryl diester phosphodiesterase membrane domain-containing protein [Novosphingobium kunmingense]PKB14737.1 glycerophosphoryl diester phosphodiesterase family protein [Novosphingobium kunmingense]